jgi:hypothetical protein
MMSRSLGKKTRGQLAYERDVARRPNFGDGGGPRPSWGALGRFRRWWWEVYPVARGDGMEVG